MALSCEEIHEQITAYVDDRIDEEQYRRDVERHIEACPSCRSAFEEEVAVKMIVRKRYSGATTPESVRTGVEESIEALARAAPGRAGYARRKSSGGSKFPVLALLVIVTLLAGYILFFEDWGEGSPASKTESTAGTSHTQGTPAATHHSTGPANYFNLALTEFSGLKSGEIGIEYPADDLNTLIGTFGRNGVEGVAFEGASLPLKGGIAVEHNDSKFAGFVYEQGSTRLLVLDVPWSVLSSGRPVYVTSDVATQLLAGESIWQHPDGKTHLVMFKRGDAGYTAVSNGSPAEIRGWLHLPDTP